MTSRHWSAILGAPLPMFHLQGWPEPYIYGVYTVFLAGESPNVRSYMVNIYGFGQPHTYTITLTHTYTHIYRYIQTHIHTQIHTRTHVPQYTTTLTHTHTHTHTHTQIHTQIHTNTHTHTRTHTHTHTNTHTHIHTRTHVPQVEIHHSARREYCPNFSPRKLLFKLCGMDVILKFHFPVNFMEGNFSLQTSFWFSKRGKYTTVCQA